MKNGIFIFCGPDPALCFAIAGRDEALNNLFKPKTSHDNGTLVQWTGQDSNPLPPRCKRGALPGELPALKLKNILKRIDFSIAKKNFIVNLKNVPLVAGNIFYLFHLLDCLFWLFKFFYQPFD